MCVCVIRWIISNLSRVMCLREIEMKLVNGHPVSCLHKETASAVLETQKQLVMHSNCCLQMPLSICLCLCITDMLLVFIHKLSASDLSELRICVNAFWQKHFMCIYFFNQKKTQSMN